LFADFCHFGGQYNSVVIIIVIVLFSSSFYHFTLNTEKVFISPHAIASEIFIVVVTFSYRHYITKVDRIRRISF